MQTIQKIDEHILSSNINRCVLIDVPNMVDFIVNESYWVSSNTRKLSNCRVQSEFQCSIIMSELPLKLAALLTSGFCC